MTKVSDDELAFIADEQAALRQVATLVARGAPSPEVFATVCEQTGRLMGASHVNLARYVEGVNETMAGWSERGNHLPTGSVWSLDDGFSIDAVIQTTRKPTRVDSYGDAAGPLAEFLRDVGVRAEVGAPVFVNGQVWGALVAGCDDLGELRDGSEQRVASFAELIALAVANEEARAEVLASRARLVTARDTAQRRLARDIHDGAQQRLVSAIVNLSLAQDLLEEDPAEARNLLRGGQEHVKRGLEELRELAAGVYPAILTNRGLRAAANSLARKGPLEVEVDIPETRFAADNEAAAYFVISEALANTTKHGNASHASVRVAFRAGFAHITISDDGVGGADPTGHGLRGLRDRVQALGGSFELASPSQRGTRIAVSLPVGHLPDSGDVSPADHQSGSDSENREAPRNS
jgi:signal transduction histidine kinase